MKKITFLIFTIFIFQIKASEPNTQPDNNASLKLWAHGNFWKQTEQLLITVYLHHSCATLFELKKGYKAEDKATEESSISSYDAKNNCELSEKVGQLPNELEKRWIKSRDFLLHAANSKDKKREAYLIFEDSTGNLTFKEDNTIPAI